LRLRILCKRPDAKKPLTDSELLALVAGNALNENIAHEIESRGLAFSATDAYRSQLTAAGADAHVLTALSKAMPVKPSHQWRETVIP